MNIVTNYIFFGRFRADDRKYLFYIFTEYFAVQKNSFLFTFPQVSRYKTSARYLHIMEIGCLKILPVLFKIFLALCKIQNGRF